jgi:hypothetical protein
VREADDLLGHVQGVYPLGIQFHFVGGVATILALHWLYAKSCQSGCWSDLANIKQNIINVKIHILEGIKFIKASMQSMILSMH